jgi:hypothetical protein
MRSIINKLWTLGKLKIVEILWFRFWRDPVMHFAKKKVESSKSNPLLATSSTNKYRRRMKASIITATVLSIMFQLNTFAVFAQPTTLPPSFRPTSQPTDSPSLNPTLSPTTSVSAIPTNSPTRRARSNHPILGLLIHH